MIELKPYRGITASNMEKGDKTRLAGEVQTGAQAYAWYENSSLTTGFACAFVVGLMLAILLIAITKTPIWFCVFAIGCIVGAYMLSAWWQNYLRQYIGQPSLLVSSERAGRGDDIEVHFRQPINRDLLIEKSTIELVAVERVSYKCGTNTCTASHDLIIQTEHDARQHQLTAGQTYEQRVTLTIPRQAMHSFVFTDNSLTWIIRVTMQSSGLSALTETYAIQVTPEVHTL
jgi:hypothetical protein